MKKKLISIFMTIILCYPMMVYAEEDTLKLAEQAVHGQTLYLVDPAGVLVSKIQIQSLTEKIGAHRLHGDGGLGARGPRPKGQQGKQHGQGQSQRQQPCPLFGDSHGVVFSFRCSDEMRHAPRHGALNG